METFRNTPRLARGHDAYASVAWRAPEARRFEPQVANDATAEVRAEEAGSDGRWLIVLVGAVVAAVLGMMLGGAMAL